MVFNIFRVAGRFSPKLNSPAEQRGVYAKHLHFPWLTLFSSGLFAPNEYLHPLAQDGSAQRMRPTPSWRL